MKTYLFNVNRREHRPCLVDMGRFWNRVVRVWMALAILVAAVRASAATILSVENRSALAGASVGLSVNLGQGGNAVVGAQFDLTFDTNSVSLSATTRLGLTNHLMRSRQLAPGRQRVLIYSLQNSNLPDGEILRLQFLIHSNVADGIYALSLSNAILANQSGMAVLPLAVTNGAINVVTLTNCFYALSATNASFPASGGLSNVLVLAPDTCAWEVINTNAWISIASGSNGFGNGVVSYTVTSNGSALAQSGRLLIAGQTYAVMQAGAPCVYSLSSTYAAFSTAGGSNKVTVTALAGCNWTVVNTNAWIAIRQGSNGTGNGLVSYTVAKNTKRKLRVGTLLIAGQPYLVIQSDTTRPTLAIVRPTARTKIFTNASLMLMGIAHDNVGVARVEYSLNSKTNYLAANGTTNWSALTTLTAGKNTLRVRSIDLAGNVSAVVTRTYLYKPPASAPKAANIASVTRDGTGCCDFRFTVTPGHTYVLQASTDLQHWSNLRTNVATTGTLTFSDLFDRSFPQRFYRVVEAQ